MSQKAVRYLVVSQLSLLIFIGICVLLIPHFLLERNEGGMSNYGTYSKTVLPYTAAFLLSSIYVWRAASILPRNTDHLIQFRRMLYALACLLAFVLVTTYLYKLNNGFGDLHLLATIAIFCFEILVSAWLALVLYRSKLSSGLFLLQVVGFGLAVCTFIGAVHFLFIVQLVTGGSFGILLVRTGRHLAL